MQYKISSVNILLLRPGLQKIRPKKTHPVFFLKVHLKKTIKPTKKNTKPLFTFPLKNLLSKK